MDNTVIRNLAVDQLSALRQLAQNEGHTDLVEQFETIQEALRADKTLVIQGGTANTGGITLEQVMQVLTENFSPEDAKQKATEMGFDDVDEYREAEAQSEETDEMLMDSSHAVGMTSDGNYVGSLEEMAEIGAEYLEQSHTIYDDETDEPLFVTPVEEVPTVDVLFTRQDNQRLSPEDVENRILNHHRAGVMLDAFGEQYEFVDVPEQFGYEWEYDEDTDEETRVPVNTDNMQVLRFTIDNSDDTSRVTSQLLANQAASFRGAILIPGLGMVQAQAVLN